MISDSDETYTSSTNSSTVVPDRVQKLFEKLKKEKSLDSRNNRNVTTKIVDASKPSKNNGKGYNFNNQCSVNQFNSSKIIRSEPNFNENSPKTDNNKTNSNKLNSKNALQQDGKVKKSAEEIWKEKMNSLVTGKTDTTETEDSGSETLSEVLFRKAFTSEVSDEQYSKRKTQSKISMSNAMSKDTDFARKKAEEWLRASTLTAKDGKSDSRGGLDIGDSSAAEETDSDSDLQTNFIQPKRNDPKKSSRGKPSRNMVNGKIVNNSNAGTSKGTTRPSDEKQPLKSSLSTKKTPLAGRTELPKKTGLAKKSETSKVTNSSKKSDSEKKTDFTRKTESVKKSVTMYAANSNPPEIAKMSKVGSQGISKGPTPAARSSISSTAPTAAAGKVGQRPGLVTSKKITTNTTSVKKPSLISNETTKANSKQHPSIPGMKKTTKKS